MLQVHGKLKFWFYLWLSHITQLDSNACTYISESSAKKNSQMSCESATSPVHFVCSVPFTFYHHSCLMIEIFRYWKYCQLNIIDFLLEAFQSSLTEKCGAVGDDNWYVLWFYFLLSFSSYDEDFQILGILPIECYPPCFASIPPQQGALTCIQSQAHLVQFGATTGDSQWKPGYFQ